MWTLVEPDNTPGRHDGEQDSRPSGTLASRLPDLDESVINADPVATAGRPSVWRVFGFTGLSLILAAGLVAQIGYRHLAGISQHETLRPWLLAFCDVAGCVLPTRLDSNMIISNHLSIEPHPDYQNVLQMTLGFTNHADFPQPLPAIELVYSDTRGREVAGRRFYPRHYLPNDLNNARGAPASTQIPLAMSADASLTAQLDFATPAADAVNYQVRFVHE